MISRYHVDRVVELSLEVEAPGGVSGRVGGQVGTQSWVG
jgi:hypothetical protein